MKRIRICLFGFPLFLGLVPAQTQPGQNPACVSDTIDWVLPGHFDDAVARAKAEKRLILIKGVSFGIDEAGAKCATKGKW